MKWVVRGVVATWLSVSVAVQVQAQAPVTAEDTQAIQALAAGYLRTLGGCDAGGFADLFVPETGYFSSGFRGQIAGREGLIGLVESERHCNQAPGTAARPGSGNAAPVVQLEARADGVYGVVDLGPQVGQYEDRYSKTPAGWRIASRTVVTKAELDAGLSAADLAAINALGGPSPGNRYAGEGSERRLLSTGVVISVADGKVSGRAYQADGSYFDDVYERGQDGAWRIQSRVHVPADGVNAAQVAPARRGAVLGTGTFTSFVEDMDRSLAFYRDALGMEVPDLPESGTRPYNPTNVQLFAMFNIQGAKERHQAASVPGTNVRLEMMEIQDVEHKTIPLRIQDPGIVTPVLIVRDVDALLARVVQAQGEVATPGGKPVLFADGTRAVLIRDVDGRFVELRQPADLPAADPAATSGILEQRLSIAVHDMAATTGIYGEVLGFAIEPAVAADPALRELTGLAGLAARRALARGPGGSLVVEFFEYGGVDRQVREMRIQDRGAARLQVRAENLDELVVAMKNAGMQVHSEGGVATPIPPNFKGALVADPNNFFLTPFAPCDACAPTLQSTRN